MNYSDAFEKFERLKQEQEHHFAACEKRLENWVKFKHDYDILKDRLLTLPDETRYDVMVPISKKGFMPGKLVHTNEILVLLGDNWFVDRSAKQAVDIITRRSKGIDEHIEKLHQEKKALQDAIKWTETITKEKSEFVNIEEKLENDVNVSKPVSVKTSQLSEDKKKELRKKQQQRALEFQAKINSEMRKEEDSEEEESDEDEENEANIKDEEADEDSDDEPKDIKEIEETEEGNVNIMEAFARDIQNSALKSEIKPNAEPNELLSKNAPLQVDETSQSTQGKFYFEDMLEEYEKSINRENNKGVSKLLKRPEKKGVKWSDFEQKSNELNDIKEIEVAGEESSEDEYSDSATDYDSDKNESFELVPKVINFKHTISSELDQVERNLKVSRDKPNVDNPGDIYKIYYQPKSILKTKSTNETDTQRSSDLSTNSTSEPRKVVQNENKIKFEPQKAFTGEIVEKQTQSQLKDDLKEFPNKPKISKFRASKMK